MYGFRAGSDPVAVSFRWPGRPVLCVWIVRIPSPELRCCRGLSAVISLFSRSSVVVGEVHEVCRQRAVVVSSIPRRCQRCRQLEGHLERISLKVKKESVIIQA